MLNKDLGNRLWGISFGIWILISWNIQYSFWLRLLSAIIMGYFFIFGNSRFDGKYTKII